MKTRIIIISLLGMVAALIMLRVFAPSERDLEGMIFKPNFLHWIGRQAPIVIILLLGVVAALIMLRAFRPSRQELEGLVTESTDPRGIAPHETTAQQPRPGPAVAAPAGGPERPAKTTAESSG